MSSMQERLEALEKEVFGDKNFVTEIAVVQDRSTSMSGLVDATISGYNEYVEDLKKDESDEAYLTLIQFDTRYEIMYKRKPVKDVPKLTREGYKTRGMTALYDSVGRAVAELEEHPKATRTRYLVVIMTDGEENSSREFGGKEIKSLIEEKEATGDWTFVFLGAGVEKWVGHELGVRDSNTLIYAATADSVGDTYSGLSQATSALRGSAGGQSVNFVADMTPKTSSSGGSVNIAIDPVNPKSDDDDDGQVPA